MPWVILVFSSTPLPAFIGKDFDTTTESSATSHHKHFPLGLPLAERAPDRIHQAMVQGFPG